MPFSRKFVHFNHGTPYDILQDCPSTGTAVCKTSFEQQLVSDYLAANSTADEIKIIEVKKDAKYYFALLAKRSGQDLDDPLVGKLPCPKECIPPSFRDNSSFNPVHVSNVINTTDCLWLQVHRSGKSGLFTYDDFTIYALTDDGHGGLNEEDDYGDEVYTTEN